MNCCPHCFNDKFIRDVLIQKSVDIGICEFCKSREVELLEAVKLTDYFQPIFDLYEKVADGKLITELVNNDWKLFIHIDDEIALQLLENILGVDLDTTFIAKENGDSGRILDWQEFKEELKHDNRYFPQKAPSKEHLEELLHHLLLLNDEIPNYLYRSRINESEEQIPIVEMGKPPAKISTAGRANPIGIPYLYTASTIKTAISEIRPHKGDKVTVAKFEVKDELKLADLRDPRVTISPFSLDDDGLTQVFKDLEYLSSQYLCELIKHFGFDGVIYKSSVGDGDNYAIFKDECLVPLDVETYIVSNVNIDFDESSSIDNTSYLMSSNSNKKRLDDAIEQIENATI